jgi:hypothetical protein
MESIQAIAEAVTTIVKLIQLAGGAASEAG